jgi:hypothetical protein
LFVCTWPPLHLDAVVAMRSESRAGPRAMATVIFSFCFFEMHVFVCRTADRHTRAALRKEGKHSQAHAGVCTDGSDAQRPRECVLEIGCIRFNLRG